MLLGLTIIAAVFLALAGASMLRKPKTKAKTMLIDDEGYRFGDDPLKVPSLQVLDSMGPLKTLVKGRLVETMASMEKLF